MLRAFAVAAAMAVFATSPAHAETAANAALGALKELCLADATKPFAPLAARLGFADDGVQVLQTRRLTKWSKTTDDGHVVVMTSPAVDDYNGSVCSVNLHGAPGSFLKTSETFLLDAQFTRLSKPKDDTLDSAFHLQKLSWDGHHAWVITGGAKRPAQAAAGSAEPVVSEPLSFVQVSYFRVKFLN